MSVDGRKRVSVDEERELFTYHHSRGLVLPYLALLTTKRCSGRG